MIDRLGKMLNVGDEVVLCDKEILYVGKIESFTPKKVKIEFITPHTRYYRTNTTRDPRSVIKVTSFPLV